MDVLVVDDCKMDRELIKCSLLDSGTDFNMKEACSAQEGLERISESHFDIILIDYQMPKMNGVELLSELKARISMVKAPIIVMSHHNDQTTMLECINAGAQDFLLKEEVTPNQLIRSIMQSQKRFELENQLFHSYRQVKHLAEVDRLTGLHNRYHFEDKLKEQLQRGANGNQLAFMLLDIDDFKKINDNFGHDVGDQLLVMVSKRICKRFRDSEYFCRLGGDEFAFAFSDISEAHEALVIAKRLLGVFDQAFKIKHQLIHCSASLGVALYPSNGRTVEDLHKLADIAMYRAKKLGRNKFCLFEDDMLCEFYKAYKIEQELRGAILESAFELKYQSVNKSDDGEILGFEALLRWPAGITSQNPDEFIPIAEQTRLIEPLGRWILKTAIAQLARFIKLSNKPVSMAINLSPFQLHDLNLVPYLEDLIKRFKIPPSAITLEITETALLTKDTSTTETLEKLKSTECMLALDDFGTGYSSISHLLDYPIDIVKFDKSIIDGTQTDSKYVAVLEGLTKTLKKMGVVTVAEGIEDLHQVELCQDIGLDRLQGYFFSRPISAAECELLLTS